MSSLKSRVKSKAVIIDKTAPPREPPATAVCALESCGRRFEAGKRQNQYQHPGAAHVSTARYCCDAHRVAAYRIRRAIRAGIPRSRQRNKIAPKQSAGTHTHATVTTPEIRKENQMAADGFLTVVGRAAHARQGDRRLVDATAGVLAEIAQAVAEGRIDDGGPWTEERGRRASALIEQRGMYRVRLPDGRLSDLLNQTRANDLSRMLAGVGAQQPSAVRRLPRHPRISETSQQAEHQSCLKQL